jgi:RNA polymerase sigma factor (sigma-70 family)
MKRLDIHESIQWRKLTLGDQESFRFFYEKYVDDLFSFGMKFLQEEDAVKDAIHDLFLDLYTYREKISHEVNVKYYLLFSLKRKLIANKKQSVFKLSGNTGTVYISEEFQNSQEEVYIDRESHSEIQEVFKVEINALSERQKEAIYLKYSQDLSYEEIASIMGVNVATCRTLIYRAIKQLRSRIKFSQLAKSFDLILN